MIKNFNYIQQDFIVPDPTDPDFIVKMTQYLRDIAKELRYKQTIIQTIEEQIIGEEAGRTIFGKTIDFGALPNTGTKCIPHGITITDSFRWRKIYAIAQKKDGTAIGINIAKNFVNAFVTPTNICIETSSNRSDFIYTTIFLEYIKNI
jgi:hypothetical protein